MIYLFLQYWIFIALAFILGLFVGWATCDGEARPGEPDGGWLYWAVAAFIAGVFVAAFKWIPGLPGHLLEIALLLFGAYVLGCATGCGCKRALAGDSAQVHDHGHAHGHAHAAKSVGHDGAAAEPALAFTHESVFPADSLSSYPGVRPAAMAAPAAADDLTRLPGVDLWTAKTLRDIGVHLFRQIADWQAPNLAWVEHHFAQPGRIAREGWVEAAQKLARG